MKNKIRTYTDLIREKQQLEADLIHQKAAIRNDLIELQEEFRPAIQLFSFLGKMSKASRTNPLVAIGVSLMSEVLFKNTLLAKSGKVTRIILPYLVKKAADLFLKNGGVIQRLALKLKKTRSNGHSVHF